MNSLSIITMSFSQYLHASSCHSSQDTDFYCYSRKFPRVFCRKHLLFLHRPLLAHFLFLLLDLCQDFREMEPHSRLFQAGSWGKLIANVSIPISTQVYAASSYTALWVRYCPVGFSRYICLVWPVIQSFLLLYRIPCYKSVTDYLYFLLPMGIRVVWAFVIRAATNRAYKCFCWICFYLGKWAAWLDRVVLKSKCGIQEVCVRKLIPNDAVLV